MGKISLSVVIPYYNTPQEVCGKCFDSVLKNDLKNIEVLIVDDGSAPEYRQILDEIAKDSRVRVFCEGHRGVSAARNAGIRYACGDWIAFLDSDDFFTPETFQRIVNSVDEFTGDIEIFTGGAASKDGEGTVPNTDFLEENTDYGTDKARRVSIMKSALSAGKIPEGYLQYFTYGAIYCKIFRREFLLREKLQFDETVTFAEDTLFMLYAYQKAGHIFFHNWYFYNYVFYEGSVTRKFRPDITKDMDHFFARIDAFQEEYGLKEDLERAYYTRAQFEAWRGVLREFYHLENRDPDRKKKYWEFIRREPYKTALEKRYIPSITLREKFTVYLIEHGMRMPYNAVLRIHRLKTDLQTWLAEMTKGRDQTKTAAN